MNRIDRGWKENEIGGNEKKGMGREWMNEKE